jgi:hypothetical protein
LASSCTRATKGSISSASGTFAAFEVQKISTTTSSRSAFGREHVGLSGDYVWAADAQPEPGALRPLRDRPSLLAA